MSDDEVRMCNCNKTCLICGGLKKIELSIFDRTFWDLWIQKLLRNFASMKFQWLLFLYAPTVWGMFHIMPGTNEPWISASIGLGFLGGGFVTLALGRIYAKTKLRENGNDSHDELDTDQ
jgi:hypothetical protein